MPDEYYTRYSHYTHDQLYQQLLQGSPPTLARQADVWRQAAQTAGHVAGKLSRDLRLLAANWTGLGADEFQSRVDLVTAYAQKLADEAASIGVGAEAMSRALGEAQRQAQPDPAGPAKFRPALGSDPASLRVALRVAATSWTTPEAVLGPDQGHMPPPEEQAAARERMVTLVAELAILYGVIDQANWPRVIPDGPLGMPGTVTAEAGPDLETTAGLAGAGPMLGSAGPAAGLTVPAGPSSGPVALQPAVMLSGGGPGLAGAAKPAVNTSSSGSPAAISPTAAMSAAPMMMAGGPVIGQQPGGGADPGLVEGSDAWANHGAAWAEANANGETPDAVLGELA